MSGMLPGVECARRRRLHNSAGDDSTSNRSFCLYTTRNLQSSSSLLERSMLNRAYPDENLGGAAREAKRRLDQKFMAHIKSESHKRKGLFHGLWRQLRSQS
uniref:Uncharacterized protein n=3 Tax=Glycine subgen. Soja TaxID=1462606 RepID=C6T1G3_SOYBN|nr:unknown [Glycine max]|eukprot:NP_001236714.1 uncharacterized protein LOC100500350 [Glycine max]